MRNSIVPICAAVILLATSAAAQQSADTGQPAAGATSTHVKRIGGWASRPQRNLGLLDRPARRGAPKAKRQGRS